MGKAAIPTSSAARLQWLDLAHVAQIEASSEEKDHPVTAVLSSEGGPGWRASAPGEQVIRVVFRRATRIRRVHVLFRETALERSQEFTLQWSSHRGETHRQIVRQQFNFSPYGATCEVEDYDLDVPDAAVLELRIVPDIRGGEARASLAELRIA